MKITLLGTGTSQGVPVIACKCETCLSSDLKDKRLRSSVLIEVMGKKIVIDTGPDFRQQMLSNDVDELDAILFTHEHKDHIAGLDDVRAFNHKWKRDMEVYASKRVQDALRREFHYVFSGDNYPGIPSINLNTIDNSSFFIDHIEVIPIEVLHYKLPVFGFRIDNFAYLTDVSMIPEKEKEKMYGLDLLIIDALRKKEHISHFNLDQALSFIDEINPKESLLTHISHYMGNHNDLASELPDNINPGYDGQIILLD